MFQMDRLKLQIARPSGETENLETPGEYTTKVQNIPPGPGYNVAPLYALLEQRLNGEELELPDFIQALRVHRLLDAIRKSASTGIRQDVI
ncbi:hypothetical protein D3C80_1858330 [compost metagenome]